MGYIRNSLMSIALWILYRRRKCTDYRRMKQVRLILFHFAVMLMGKNKNPSISSPFSYGQIVGKEGLSSLVVVQRKTIKNWKLTSLREIQCYVQPCSDNYSGNTDSTLPFHKCHEVGKPTTWAVTGLISNLTQACVEIQAQIHGTSQDWCYNKSWDKYLRRILF